MLIVAVCLLNLDSLRKWWKGIGGKELSAFARELQESMDRQYEAFGKQMSRYMWGDPSTVNGYMKTLYPDSSVEGLCEP